MSQCMIFCRTNLDCDNLESFLVQYGGGARWKQGKKETGKENPYSCCVLAGMKSVDHRRAALEAFTEGYVRFLICTDVAARGIDVKGLPYIINMTLPDEPENYIHRIGRVGRSDHLGLAISILSPVNCHEKVWYHRCGTRGIGCTNRSLLDAGGCTIWYDETELLRKIENRIHSSIPELDSDFSLPEIMGANLSDYGEEVKKEKIVPNQHVEKLRPTVKLLASMEFDAQNLFLLMSQNKFKIN